ncbi:hypothetical protein ACQP1G_03020 [Nocardia sp. CA-107356]|uniref:hypothetical protein n=1 Tax=Nocardia sp. CA-107356 TaxID=3239972 RepID=UPI003D949A46
MADRVKQHVLDRLLRIAAERAAAPSGLRFTERQLYYEVCRILTPMRPIPRHFAFTVPAPLTYASFRTALDRHAELPGLLTITPPKVTRAGRHTPEPDLFDYGLPRLLVCESDAIAQMLRANGLPMESACPVFSAAELPLDPGIAGMLAQVEGTIYLLHDASADGLTFPARLAQLTDIPDGVRIVPLGLRPRQAGTLHLPHVRDRGANMVAAQVDSSGTIPLRRSSAPSVEAARVDSCEREKLSDELASSAGAARVDSCERAELSGTHASRTLVAQVDSWERAWLRRGRFVEVEAVRPASLLRTVHRLVREVHPPRTTLTELRRARNAGFLTWPAA